MSEDEQVVRTFYGDSVVVFEPTEMAPNWMVQAGDRCFIGPSLELAWKNARVPIDEYRKDVAEREEEIYILTDRYGSGPQNDIVTKPIVDRAVQRLRKELDAVKKAMS